MVSLLLEGTRKLMSRDEKGKDWDSALPGAWQWVNMEEWYSLGIVWPFPIDSWMEGLCLSNVVDMVPLRVGAWRKVLQSENILCGNTHGIQPSFRRMSGASYPLFFLILYVWAPLPFTIRPSWCTASQSWATTGVRFTEPVSEINSYASKVICLRNSIVRKLPNANSLPCVLWFFFYPGLEWLVLMSLRGYIKHSMNIEMRRSLWLCPKFLDGELTANPHSLSDFRQVVELLWGGFAIYGCWDKTQAGVG